MIKHTDEHNSAKLKWKGTQPTADVNVGYDNEAKSGSGAKMDSGLIGKAKSGVGTGGTDAAKKGSGAENYFDSLKGMANKREVYPSEAK